MPTVHRSTGSTGPRVHGYTDHGRQLPLCLSASLVPSFPHSPVSLYYIDESVEMSLSR